MLISLDCEDRGDDANANSEILMDSSSLRSFSASLERSIKLEEIEIEF